MNRFKMLKAQATEEYEVELLKRYDFLNTLLQKSEDQISEINKIKGILKNSKNKLIRLRFFNFAEEMFGSLR
jgi:hypothetical protein